MADLVDDPKHKSPSEKKEKKKRKHKDAAETASPNKKLKSHGRESKFAANGVPSNRSDHLSADQVQLAHELVSSNGSQVNGESQDTAPQETPRKKKKSKSSQQNGADDHPNGEAVQDTTSVTSPHKKKSRVPKEDSDAHPTSPSPSKKSKLKNKRMAVEADEMINGDATTPMDVDPNPIDITRSSPIVDEDPIPFIKRPLRSILSSASSSQISNISRSPFFRQATQLYLPLSPVTLPSPLEGLCAEHLSPLLLKYYPPLHGVVLSYANPRFSKESSSGDGTSLAISVAEYATPMVWIDVEFLLFRPKRGHQVEGKVVLQSESHIGLQVYNLFSGRIPKDRLPKDWTWMGTHNKSKGKFRKGRLKGGDGEQDETRQEHDEEELGHWTDGQGHKVDGVINFFVWDVDIALGGRDTERNLPTIEGTLLKTPLSRVADNVASHSKEKRRTIKEGKRKSQKVNAE